MPSTPPTFPNEPSRREVWRMFDRIAPRYDLLNRLLSGGLDVWWRRRVADFLPEGSSLVLLDVATGTADQLLTLMGRDARVVRATGIDMAERMLEIGREKAGRRGWSERVHLQTGDATAIPLDAEQFDATTVSFGIRNVVDVPRALSEMRRVLRPGGRVLILEFSLPSFRPFRAVYLFYLRHVLPWLGGLLSGDREAYRYLNVTIESFPYGEAFCRLMREAGLVNVRANPLSLGIATLYQGDRPVTAG
jgi:demethylmenaquinone methyltransferase/2-methoxy-6-polyprenyl-1,4-benzoquinol methylase